MTATKINEYLKVPKPTIHRLCQAMEAEGFLEKDLDESGYIPGRRQRMIAAGVTAFSTIVQARKMVLKQLAEDIGETCNILVPGENGMMYLERVETQHALCINLPVGKQVPLYSTSSGKLYLSSLKRSQRVNLIYSVELQQFAKNTITDPSDLLEDLESVRKQGFSLDDEGFLDEMVALAIPICDLNGKMVAALTCHAPKQRVSVKQLLKYKDRMEDAAERIRETFGLEFD